MDQQQIVSTPLSSLQVAIETAKSKSSEEFIWAATLRSSEVILEQPGLSSDHLPRDEVVRIEYIPTRRHDFPVITCRVNLERGERFVRYWSNVWKPAGQGIQRIYVVGIEATEKRHALMGFYPMFKKFVVSHTRPFQPPWLPESLSLLPQGVVAKIDPGTNSISWLHQGFGGVVLARGNQLVFSGQYG